LQGTTLATELVFRLADWAFTHGYRRVEWKCDSLNAASRRAALRFGFEFEGVFRQAAVVRGRNRDTAWFALIDQDWPRLKRAYEAWLHPHNFDSEGRQLKRLSECREM
jgi:RimJ/RimL family protein N-acetyltransferase